MQFGINFLLLYFILFNFFCPKKVSTERHLWAFLLHFIIKFYIVSFRLQSGKSIHMIMCILLVRFLELSDFIKLYSVLFQILFCFIIKYSSIFSFVKSKDILRFIHRFLWLFQAGAAWKSSDWLKINLNLFFWSLFQKLI